MPGKRETKLRIIHCFRSPVGGIFRHVRDLILSQTAQGHEVGVICDNNTGGSFEEERLAELETILTLGLNRISMERSIGPKDIAVIWNLYKNIKTLKADVLHAHGAKGGAYIRIIRSLPGNRKTGPKRLYCPHGGSIHYDRNKISGRVYFGLEKLLERFTDRLIFVSAYERDGYFKNVGKARCPHTLVRNGLAKGEFEPVSANKKATDFLYIGMMRDLKGVDLFLDALPLVAKNTGRSANKPLTATLVGDGPDLESYKARAQNLGELVSTKFLNPLPAREAFGLGKTLVIPSRAESMPYIVLEALAAKRPMLATNVGGIPEIFGEYSRTLIEPDNLDALVHAMGGQLDGSLRLPPDEKLFERIQENFTVEKMAEEIMQAYRDTLQPA